MVPQTAEVSGQAAAHGEAADEGTAGKTKTNAPLFPCASEVSLKNTQGIAALEIRSKIPCKTNLTNGKDTRGESQLEWNNSGGKSGAGKQFRAKTASRGRIRSRSVEREEKPFSARAWPPEERRTERRFVVSHSIN